jgi:hypothetical protein
MKARNRDSCHHLFMLLNILPFYSQYIYIYIFSVPMFVVKDMNMFILNSDIHIIHTRHGSGLHHPTYKLAKVQKGVFYFGIAIFNNLPQNVKNLSRDANKFKYAISFFMVAPFSPRGNILTEEQRKIWVLINDIYIDFPLLYMVTML